MTITRLLLAGAVLAAVLPGACFAQANTTTTGLFGGQTLGSNTGARPATTGNSGITSGMGNSGNNNGNAGGSAGVGGTSFGTGLVSGMQQLRAGGDSGFVGASAASIGANPLSRIGTAGGPQTAQRLNFGQLGQLMTVSRQNQFNQQQAQRNTRTTNQQQGQFRVPLRLGFQPPPPQPQAFALVAVRLNRTPALAKIGAIEASLVGRKAVLRGTVATEADRELAEALVRLEPAVMEVDNQLSLASPQTLPVSSP
jgi:hypothetical protein